jgi:hypothetical protein
VRHDLGDFQTPYELAAAIVRALEPLRTRWARVLEPTCGTGAFLRAVAEGPQPPREMIGIELQEAHLAQARDLALDKKNTRIEIVHASLFDLDLRTDLRWRNKGPLLIVGNPPWVTAAALGKLRSTNVPDKWNRKGLKGLEAITGASNFDIAEAVWLKLLDELAEERPTIALLCKTAVARAVLEHALRRGLPVSDAAIFQIDAARWFKAAVGACLLRLSLGEESRCRSIPVYAGLEDPKPGGSMGLRLGRLVADSPTVDRLAFAVGACPLTWRQGVRHYVGA